MPGVASNIHEGYRSEYLAQYIFASFGTASAVGHQEDFGLDLYCTLTERVEKKAIPRQYFSVQVKSAGTSSEWLFDDPKSIEWFLNYPLPIFLCVVNKSTATISIYHTAARFAIWTTSPPIPRRVRLIPGDERVSRSFPFSDDDHVEQHGEDRTYRIQAPIVRYTVNDFLDDENHANAKAVLDSWLQMDYHNLQRMRKQVVKFLVPSGYETNRPVHPGSVSGMWVEGASPEQVDAVIDELREPLEWLLFQLKAHEDYAGAMRAALLHFYLFGKTGGGVMSYHTAIMDKWDPVHVYKAVEDFGKLIDKAFAVRGFPLNAYRYTDPNPRRR